MTRTTWPLVHQRHLIPFLVLLLPSQAQPQAGAPSAMYHIDAQHTGQSLHAGPARPITQRWNSGVQTYTSTTTGSAIGADGTVYVGSTNYNVYALDGTTGTEIWSYPTSNRIVASPAVGNDGTVYIGSMDYNMYAIDGSTGLNKWVYPTGGAIYSSAVISPTNMIYFGASNAYAYALDGATGVANWTFYASGMTYMIGCPALSKDGNVYFVATNSGIGKSVLLALNASSGVQQWSYTISDFYSFSSPAIGPDGTVYFSAASYVYAVQDGNLLWSTTLLGDANYAALAVTSGAVFVTTSAGYLYSFNLTTGSAASVYLGGDLTYASPTIGSDGLLYVARTGYLYCVNSFNVSSLLWSTQLNSITVGIPAIAADGSLVVGGVNYVQPSPSPTPSITASATQTPSIAATISLTPIPTQSSSTSSSVSASPSATSTPSYTPNPSPGVIQAVNVLSLLGSQDICGNDVVVPSWLYGIGPVQPDSMTAEPPLKYVVNLGGMTANAQVSFTVDSVSGFMQGVSITCQALSVPNVNNTYLLRYATSADDFNSSGAAYGTCSVYTAMTNGSTVLGYTVCEYYTFLDAGTCEYGPAQCQSVYFPDVQSTGVTPPLIPQCSDNSALSTVPSAWQGYGSLASQYASSERFPADVFVMDASSISFVSYGTNPLQEAAPNAYSVGATTKYCIESATPTMLGDTQGIILVVPTLAQTYDCIFGSLQPTPGAVPIFYYGTLQGQQCNVQAGTQPLPWPLTSWTNMAGSSTSPALSQGAIAAIGSVAAVAVLGAAVGFWFYRSGRFSKAKTGANAFGPVESTKGVMGVGVSATTPLLAGGAQSTI